MPEIIDLKTQLERALREKANAQSQEAKARTEIAQLREQVKLYKAALDLTTRGIPSQTNFWLERAREALAKPAPKAVR